MRRHLLPLIAFAPLLGCADDGGSSGASGPRIEELSKHRLVVGEELLFYGHDFLDADEGTTRLVFRGTFTPDQGDPRPVELVVNPVFEGTEGEGGRQILRWSRVGPFGNPFDPNGRPGVFDGEIQAETQAKDGLVTKGSRARDVKLEVLPSLLIEEFQPINADCSAPAARALAGVPYRLRVRAVGLRPVRFQYALDNVDGRDGVVEFEHTYADDAPVTEDTLGVDEPVVFNPIPKDKQFYVSVLRAVAWDADGRAVETVLPVSVHRPIEVSYGGKIELAERYEPIPVSSCIPGSVRTEVSYQENTTEERQLSVSVTVSTSFTEQIGQSTTEGWEEGIATGESVSRSLGGTEWEGETASESWNVDYERSEANSVGFSSTDGESWGWDMTQGQDFTAYIEGTNSAFAEGSLSATVGAKAEGSIPGFASVTGSVETTAGVTAGARTSSTQGNRQGVSTQRGFSAGGTHDETRSFGTTTTESRSESIGGTYALGRTRERSYEDTEARERSRVYNLGGSVTVDDAVTTGTSAAEEETWVTTSSETVGIGFSGLIPRGRYGIFYRQTTRWVRRAEVRAYDLCGLASHLGELQFNEWTWAPDLAIADDCGSEPPPPNLPAAHCFIDPCGG
jgi:hypothetical protein